MGFLGFCSKCGAEMDDEDFGEYDPYFLTVMCKECLKNKYIE